MFAYGTHLCALINFISEKFKLFLAENENIYIFVIYYENDFYFLSYKLD